jgi:testis-specific serine kinase
MLADNVVVDLPGKVVDETAALAKRGYTLGERIGKGSYATVSLAEFRCEGEKQVLACKVVDKRKAPVDFLDKFFPRELEVLMTLQHPNIIQIHSILRRGPKVFIFMRYAERGDLLEFVKEMGAMREYRAKVWFRQMADGLAYMHAKGIAHRDLKCENILISRRMNIKIADFGFARSCVTDDGKLMMSRTFCGSAAYAAPEVVDGRPYDPMSADVWSLGVILFILLNGSMPFDDTNVPKLMVDQKRRNYRFSSKILPRLTLDAVQTVACLLNPDQYSRCQLKDVLVGAWLKQSSGMERNLREIN